MSILQYHFRSRILKMNTAITVTIPEPSDHRTPPEMPLNEIYHGQK